MNPGLNNKIVRPTSGSVTLALDSFYYMIFIVAVVVAVVFT